MTTTRKPVRAADDKPFDFNLNAVKAETDLAPWRVVWGPEDRRWTLTHLEELDQWPLVAAADGGELKAMMAIFREALGGQWDEFRKIPMPGYKLRKLWAAYEEHCGVEPGELQGSTES
jgi:hypothetical protein